MDSIAALNFWSGVIVVSSFTIPLEIIYKLYYKLLLYCYCYKFDIVVTREATPTFFHFLYRKKNRKLSVIHIRICVKSNIDICIGNAVRIIWLKVMKIYTKLTYCESDDIGWLPKIVETVENLFVDAEIVPVKEWRYDRYRDVLWFGPEKSRSKIVTRFQPYGRHVSKHNIYHHFDTFQFQYFTLYRKASRCWYLESSSFSFLERIHQTLLFCLCCVLTVSTSIPQTPFKAKTQTEQTNIAINEHCGTRNQENTNIGGWNGIARERDETSFSSRSIQLSQILG